MSFDPNSFYSWLMGLNTSANLNPTALSQGLSQYNPQPNTLQGSSGNPFNNAFKNLFGQQSALPSIPNAQNNMNQMDIQNMNNPASNGMMGGNDSLRKMMMMQALMGGNGASTSQSQGLPQQPQVSPLHIGNQMNPNMNMTPQTSGPTQSTSITAPLPLRRRLIGALGTLPNMQMPMMPMSF